MNNLPELSGDSIASTGEVNPSATRLRFSELITPGSSSSSSQLANPTNSAVIQKMLLNFMLIFFSDH